MNKLDLTTIILTYNEERHIRRCLENVCPISKRVIVVDSPSTDGTVEICREFDNVEVVVHKYPGNQAAQFNWAIDNIHIDTEWVLRIDADEYLLPELVEEMFQKVPDMPADVTGIELKRRHIFMGKWVKRGIYPVILLRMFRVGKARYDNRMMDEHLALSEGRTVVMEHDFCDHSLINVSDYCRKHLNYAEREAAEIIIDSFDLRVDGEEPGNKSQKAKDAGLGAQAQEKHKKKGGYNKLPLFWRSFAYFCYRYFLKGGFLDGKEGFLFAFIQGWWYRTMVDAKVLEARKAVLDGRKVKSLTADEKQRMKDWIAKEWHITLV